MTDKIAIDTTITTRDEILEFYRAQLANQAEVIRLLRTSLDNMQKAREAEPSTPAEVDQAEADRAWQTRARQGSLDAEQRQIAALTLQGREVAALESIAESLRVLAGRVP